nr:hypothetical protein [Pedobacter heparinus]
MNVYKTNENALLKGFSINLFRNQETRMADKRMPNRSRSACILSLKYQ